MPEIAAREIRPRRFTSPRKRHTLRFRPPLRRRHTPEIAPHRRLISFRQSGINSGCCCMATPRSPNFYFCMSTWLYEQTSETASFEAKHLCLLNVMVYCRLREYHSLKLLNKNKPHCMTTISLRHCVKIYSHSIGVFLILGRQYCRCQFSAYRGRIIEWCHPSKIQELYFNL